MDRAAPRIKGIVPQFLVSDLERSLDFYTQKLGFEEEFRYQDFYAGVQRDGHTIHLKAATPSPEERRNRRENEHLDVTCGVEGLDVLHEACRQNGVEVTQAPRDMPYGREFYVADLDGYILGFLETR